MSLLRWILQWLYALIFGCIHRHTTWPHHSRLGFDYICCLDCGAEMPYSTREMRIVTREELSQLRNQEKQEHPGHIRPEPVLVFSCTDSTTSRAKAAEVGHAA